MRERECVSERERQREKERERVRERETEREKVFSFPPELKTISGKRRGCKSNP